MFLKYFEFKKPLKKKKFLKILMIKYLRKFFIIVKLNQFDIYFKSFAHSLNEFFNFFLQPLGKPFNNPLTKRVVNDITTSEIAFKFFYFFFINNKSFTYLKQKKKGRVKRKILRKLIKLNKVVD